MTDERELLKNRLTELARKSYGSDVFTFTDFLGLAEQDAFLEVKKKIHPIPYTEFGGADGAERIMVRFGSPVELGYEIPFPIATLKVEPLSQKFADRLTHRDFLGAILNLGIAREKLGDIVIIDNVGYVFASEDISDYILRELSRVKHTDVKVTVTDTLPSGSLYRTEQKRIQLASERLDAIIAKSLGLSRDESLTLFKRGLVFVSGRQIDSPSHTPKEGDVISVRGHGRMIYRGADSTTRKGKLSVTVEMYV